MTRLDELLALLTMSFMDSGRVADEFAPGIRKQLRTDVLLLLASGIISFVLAAVMGLAFQQGVVAIVLLVVGSLVIVAGVALWWNSR